jgi:hypothetical protein
LVRKQAGKGHRHGVGVQTAQIYLVDPGRLGDQIAPDESPLVVDGVQHPTGAVVVPLPRPLDLGIQGGDRIPFGPTRQVVQRSRIAEPGLGDQLGHQTVKR